MVKKAVRTKLKAKSYVCKAEGRFAKKKNKKQKAVKMLSEAIRRRGKVTEN